MENLNRSLMISILNNNIKKVKELIKKGANVNYIDKFGWSPLHTAILANNHKIVKELIKYNANINLQNKHGTTPLMLAAIKKNKKIIRILMEENALTNLSDKNGLNVFDHAKELRVFILGLKNEREFMNPIKDLILIFFISAILIIIIKYVILFIR